MYVVTKYGPRIDIEERNSDHSHTKGNYRDDDNGVFRTSTVASSVHFTNQLSRATTSTITPLDKQQTPVSQRIQITFKKITQPEENTNLGEVEFKQFMDRFKVPLMLVHSIKTKAFDEAFAATIRTERYYRGIDPKKLKSDYQEDLTQLRRYMAGLKDQVLNFDTFSTSALLVMLASGVWDDMSKKTSHIANTIMTRLISEEENCDIKRPRILLDKQSLRVLLHYIDYSSLTEEDKAAIFKRIHVCELLSLEFLGLIHVEHKEPLYPILKRIGKIISETDISYLISNLNLFASRKVENNFLYLELLSNLALICSINNDLYKLLSAYLKDSEPGQDTSPLTYIDYQYSKIQDVKDFLDALSSVKSNDSNRSVLIAKKLNLTYPSFEKNLRLRRFEIPRDIWSEGDIEFLKELAAKDTKIQCALIRSLQPTDIQIIFNKSEIPDIIREQTNRQNNPHWTRSH